MSAMLQKFEELLSAFGDLEYRDSKQVDLLERKAEMFTRKCFGEGSKYLDDLREIGFYPRIAPATDDYKQHAWKQGQEQMVNLLSVMIEDLYPESERDPTEPPVEIPNRIFVVHGHDIEMKQSVARALEKLGLDPVVLHEKANIGRTIVEKLEDYSDVGFAVILLSPDDVGAKDLPEGLELRKRARQNVILEWGLFTGKLGRHRVVVLYPETDDFELPGDYSGVLYTKYDSSGSWRLDLVRELQAAGYAVDANKIV